MFSAPPVVVTYLSTTCSRADYLWKSRHEVSRVRFTLAVTAIAAATAGAPTAHSSSLRRAGRAQGPTSGPTSRLAS